MSEKLLIDISNHKENAEVMAIVAKGIISDIVETDLTELEVDLSQEVPYKDLKTLYNNGVPLVNLIGGYLVNNTVLDEDVPENFINSLLTISEGVTRQKTWREYTLTYEKANKGLITIGWRNANGNRVERVTHQELEDYINHFSMVGIKVGSDYKNLIEQHINE